MSALLEKPQTRAEKSRTWLKILLYVSLGLLIVGLTLDMMVSISAVLLILGVYGLVIFFVESVWPYAMPKGD